MLSLWPRIIPVFQQWINNKDSEHKLKGCVGKLCGMYTDSSRGRLRKDSAELEGSGSFGKKTLASTYVAVKKKKQLSYKSEKGEALSA